MKKILLIIIVILLTIIYGWQNFLCSINLKLHEKIEIKGCGEIKKVSDFCLTADNLLLIPDCEAGNIKIYEIENRSSRKIYNLVKVIERKGYGPGELARPTVCSYCEEVTKLAVFDEGLKKIFIYDRLNRIEFKRMIELSCAVVYDLKLIDGDRVWVSGYTMDTEYNEYCLYYINLQKNRKGVHEKEYIWELYNKYGYRSNKGFNDAIEKENIFAIGAKGFFDHCKSCLDDEDLYFVWEGDLRIYKIDNLNGEIKRIFGKKRPPYIKPYPTGEFSEKAKMSFIRDIFVNYLYTIVIYEGPINREKGNGNNFHIQFYTAGGDMLGECTLPGNHDCKIWFDKKKNILYSLYINTADSYSIIIYQIEE